MSDYKETHDEYAKKKDTTHDLQSCVVNSKDLEITQLKAVLRDMAEAQKGFVRDYGDEDSEAVDVGEFYFSRFKATLAKHSKLLNQSKERDDE